MLRYQTRIVNYASGDDPRRGRRRGRGRRRRSFAPGEDWAGSAARARSRPGSTASPPTSPRTQLDRRGRQSRIADRSLDDEAEPLQAGDVPSPAPDAETTLVAREAIDRALAELPDELRLALILRDVEGLDYKEIAGATGAPIGTVESRIFRARRHMRTLLRPLVNA